jgi:hypothetical protein
MVTVLNPWTLGPLNPVFLFRLRSAYRTEEFPQIQEADMPSFRAAGAFVQGVIANRAHFHDLHYTLSKTGSSRTYLRRKAGHLTGRR